MEMETENLVGALGESVSMSTGHVESHLWETMDLGAGLLCGLGAARGEGETRFDVPSSAVEELSIVWQWWAPGVWVDEGQQWVSEWSAGHGLYLRVRLS